MACTSYFSLTPPVWLPLFCLQSSISRSRFFYFLAKIDSVVGGSFSFLPGLLRVSGNGLSSSLHSQGKFSYFPNLLCFTLNLPLPGFSDVLSHPCCSPRCILLFTSLRAAIPSGLYYYHILLSPVLLFVSLTIPSANWTIFLLRIPNFFLLHLEKNQTSSCDVYRVSAQWPLLLLISLRPFPSMSLNRCSPSPKHVLPAKGQWLLRSSFLSDCCYLWNNLA